jgi:hypothetical protein
LIEELMWLLIFTGVVDVTLLLSYVAMVLYPSSCRDADATKLTPTLAATVAPGCGRWLVQASGELLDSRLCRPQRRVLHNFRATTCQGGFDSHTESTSAWCE